MDNLANYGNAYLDGTPKQYQEALDFAEPLITKFSKEGYKIILTGHSLGGGLASYAAIRLSRPSVSSVVFNAAGLGGGLVRATEVLRDAWIADIERTMNEGLSKEWPYLGNMLDKLKFEAKLGINIPSITNIHLVGDFLALSPGQQAGVCFLLTVRPDFVWLDDSGKKINKFSTVESIAKVFNSSIPTMVIPAGSYDSALLDLFGDTAQMGNLYTKLLDSHNGLNLRTLPYEPHCMTNVISAIKIKAGINIFR